MSNSLVVTGDGEPWQIESNGVTICTSVTRPSPPFQGQVIYETDTDRTWLYDGSAWRIQHDPVGYEIVNYSPPADVDATTSASQTLWLTLPSVTSPPWATRLVATVTINNHFMITDAANYFIYPRLGGTAPGNAAIIGAYHPAASLRSSAVGICSWSGVTPSTTYPLTLYAARASGAGTMRADTITRVVVDLDWKES